MQSDLHKIIVSNQVLTMDHIKVFTYQILRGLKYLHGASILHRDMKPGNLLVNANCLLKICDFGLARPVEYNPSVSMTQEVVTQYYRPPELLMGTNHYGIEVDMWSVGCILIELLTRKIAFQVRKGDKHKAKNVIYRRLPILRTSYELCIIYLERQVTVTWLVRKERCFYSVF